MILHGLSRAVSVVQASWVAVSMNVTGHPRRSIEVKHMNSSETPLDAGVRDGDFCEVVGGTHAGKTGTVRDVQTSKSGNVTITVVQDSGERFKTLAKNVVVKTPK